MQLELPQLFGRLLFVTLVAAVMVVNGKPPHFAPDPLQGFNNDQDNSVMANNLDNSGMRPWQLELLAQRMSELNQISQLNSLNGQDFNRFDRELRSGNEIKRQSRYRLCYFNPVSCFRK
ncbi:allatostatin-like [Anthonomus grandis grandis]|uniref:allatostatin-like n=1 Tax=Anthonomus grandis grandis TaxID=2921223 RepID=UPI0021653DC6|nr:allatostatin-like [Anthonomus grandis grandis]